MEISQCGCLFGYIFIGRILVSTMKYVVNYFVPVFYYHCLTCLHLVYCSDEVGQSTPEVPVFEQRNLRIQDDIIIDVWSTRLTTLVLSMQMSLWSLI